MMHTRMHTRPTRAAEPLITWRRACSTVKNASLRSGLSPAVPCHACMMPLLHSLDSSVCLRYSLAWEEGTEISLHGQTKHCSGHCRHFCYMSLLQLAADESQNGKEFGGWLIKADFLQIQIFTDPYGYCTLALGTHLQLSLLPEFAMTCLQIC